MAGTRRVFKNALFIALGGIGNLVLAIPALRALRSLQPSMKITLLTGEPGVEKILAGEGLFDQVICHDRRVHQPLISRMALVQELARARFDVAFASSGTHSFKAGALMLLAGIPVRVGEDKHHGGWFYTHKVPYVPGAHEMEGNLEIVALAAEAPVDLLPRLHLIEAEQGMARQFLNGYGAGPSCIAMHCGSSEGSRHTRRWPRENFAAVAQALLQQGNITIVLVGGPDEKVYAAELAGMIRGRVINAAGLLSLRETAAVISACDLFIGNDSALAHLAAAVGRPVVVLFGLTDARHTRPRGERVTVLQKKAAAPGKNPLVLITVDEVLAAALALWGGAHHG